jgi:hypothetical protein
MTFNRMTKMNNVCHKIILQNDRHKKVIELYDIRHKDTKKNDIHIDLKTFIRMTMMNDVCHNDIIKAIQQNDIHYKGPPQNVTNTD